MKSDSTGPQRFGRSWPDGPDVGGPHIFTNTAVPRFDGTGCWRRHSVMKLHLNSQPNSNKLKPERSEHPAQLPCRKKMQIGLYLDWALSHSGHSWLDGGHSATPG